MNGCEEMNTIRNKIEECLDPLKRLPLTIILKTKKNEEFRRIVLWHYWEKHAQQPHAYMSASDERYRYVGFRWGCDIKVVDDGIKIITYIEDEDENISEVLQAFYPWSEIRRIEA